MRRLGLIWAAVAALLAAGCNPQIRTETPQPFALTADAMGHYCGMNVLEHPGPKGQILLKSRIEPVWFSSARDALAFTMLPDEPKDILAIYVSDMGKAASWAKPGADDWIEARSAWFVVGSSARGGMGVEEIVPFSDRQEAHSFAAEKGGRVLNFAEVPPSEVLAAGGAPPGAAADRIGALGEAGHDAR
ncbi:nitrous oxide reductase accessory protein NosL [Methylobacterium sp. 092160098-2]|jgi:copper chaperone NosL|uniref:nitrous oxide reductase accessory protein NosL n=1 Tax=Methylobacterium sp. 092160098-2 TaxID=3025129 RepID=UPI002381B1D7|nr:nitrous oxide reductase accessory protein NosL [Methylobacterium sp. 092160098-2]MDE4914682.1 nitrous oxide reductase accessory protein NosL [Methylobacterium sp. 092160098-2]